MDPAYSSHSSLFISSFPKGVLLIIYYNDPAPKRQSTFHSPTFLPHPLLLYYNSSRDYRLKPGIYPLKYRMKVGIFVQVVDVFYDKKYQCPICDLEFQSKKVRSRYVQPSSYDEDFCPHYSHDLAETNPLFYHIAVCPNCGLAFSDQSLFQNQARLHHLQQFLQHHWKPTDYGVIRSPEQAIAVYKLAIYAATVIEEDPLITAGYCLRLAWIYRYLNQQPNEERFLRLAVQAYEQAYDLLDFTQSEMSEEKVLYILGELERRLHRYQDSVRYFNRCIEVGRRSGEKKMVTRAREQWQLARQQWNQTEDYLGGTFETVNK